MDGEENAGVEGEVANSIKEHRTNVQYTSDLHMMIDSKTAVKVATSYFRELFPSATDARLEEVERSADDDFWLVTFSFAKPELTIFGAAMSNPQREYKVVKLDANTGEPLGVKIRLFASNPV